MINFQQSLPKEIPKVSISKTFDYLITYSNIVPI